MKIDELVLSLVLDVAGLKKGQAATEAALAAIRAESEKTDASMQGGAKKNAAAQKKLTAEEKIAATQKKIEQKREADAYRAKVGANEAAAKAAAKEAKVVQDGAENNAYHYAKWAAAVLGVGTALIAVNKFKNFAIDLTNSDADIYRTSQAIGILTGNLSALKGAAEKTGGSGEGITKLVGDIQSMVQSVKLTGKAAWLESGSVAGLFGMNLNFGKFIQESTPMVERLRMLQAEFAKFKSLPEAMEHGKLLNIDPDTVRFLYRAPAEYEKMIAAQRELNVTTTKDGELANARRIDWLKVQDRFESLGRTLVTALSPAFRAVANDLVTFLGKHDSIEWVVDSFKMMVTWVRQIDFKAVLSDASEFGRMIWDIVKALNAVLIAMGLIAAPKTKAEALADAQAMPDSPEKTAALKRTAGMKVGNADDARKQAAALKKARAMPDTPEKAAALRAARAMSDIPVDPLAPITKPAGNALDNASPWLLPLKPVIEMLRKPAPTMPQMPMTPNAGHQAAARSGGASTSQATTIYNDIKVTVPRAGDVAKVTHGYSNINRFNMANSLV